MVIHEHLKFMSVRTVPIVRYDPNVPKQKKAITGKFIIMRSGKSKSLYETEAFGRRN